MEIGKKSKLHNLTGTGIWNTYFEPAMSSGVDVMTECPKLPIVTLSSLMVYPGLHTCAPWSVQGWAHPWIPKYLRPEYRNETMEEWIDQRHHAASVVVRDYFRPLPWLQEDYQRANPNKDGACLAMHIRLTDKADGRSKLSLSDFEPYARYYAEHSPSAHKIFVATDDETVLDTIKVEWSSFLSDNGNIRLLYRNDTLRGSNNQSMAVFDQYNQQRHRTNTEALSDIYAMSRCHHLVHGYSAMSDASIAINYEYLRHQAFNLDLHLGDEMLQRFQRNVMGQVWYVE
ncbi:MAG: hypothetical protein SGILL_004305 [Bacillariaceae sp.]